jgi:hypothetical protein
MALIRTRLVVLVAASAAVMLFLASPSTASSSPCWRSVVADWSDGRLDGEYRASCYRVALRRLPEDLRVYGTAATDIHRALLSAVSRSSGASAGVGSASAAATPKVAGWPWWLLAAAVSGLVVGLAALVSLRSARLRKKP